MNLKLNHLLHAGSELQKVPGPLETVPFLAV